MVWIQPLSLFIYSFYLFYLFIFTDASFYRAILFAAVTLQISLLCD